MGKNFIVGFIFLFIINFSYGVLNPDSLNLVGKVIKISNNTVVIDVKTSSCKGIRTFYIKDNLSGFFKKDKVVDFFIDSSECEPDKTYTIIEVNRK